ncbi:MAG: hypothetical protein KKE39_09425 [Bacteroidetes bacterium]|nr:hypothetical protein [Bacteroidota bacterium]MBU1372596.1 hypothetical protein [Bacteroidota bacterium]MBU1484792.1 hypothetical protein [Bacteroidota bacterium]MBU1762080.1 hypothetical protein [Bacteroidota bacterium]MBU2267724.1 hypothetical protein [Bacteroidota bacterium]
MLSEYNIQKAGTIDQIVFDYFKLHPKVKEIQAKDLMEDFIKGGVFSKDYKDGLPLRDFLKKLEDNDSLDLFKQTKLIRKVENKYWFFVKRTKK